MAVTDLVYFIEIVNILSEMISWLDGILNLKFLFIYFFWFASL